MVNDTSTISIDGWVIAARRIESANFDRRPVDARISLIVIHAISLPPAQFGGEHIERLFTNKLDPAAHPYFEKIASTRVSAHFLIRRDGELLQFVSCLERAWHAGVSSWQGVERCNDFSIGVELEGCDEMPYAEPQYARLVELVGSLCAVFPIDSIVGHSDIAPGRKTDPGPLFCWPRLGGFAAVHCACR